MIYEIQITTSCHASDNSSEERWWVQAGSVEQAIERLRAAHTAEQLWVKSVNGVPDTPRFLLREKA